MKYNRLNKIIKSLQSLMIACLLFLPLSTLAQYVPNPQAPTPSPGTSRQFTDKERDETNLNYFKARYYDARTGRFNQADPVMNRLHDDSYIKQTTGGNLENILQNPQNFNTYNYTNNNPIKRVDNDGKWFKEVMTGKQSLPDFYLEYGQAGEDLYNSNSTARIIMDHPVASGAAIGIGSGIAAATGSWLTGQGGVVLPMLMNKGDQINVGESFGKLGTVIDNASGKINSFLNRGNSHGLDQIITRGVKPADILETVKTPLLRLQQDGGNVLYLSEKAVIVLNKFNNVVTAYSKGNFERPIKMILERLAK